MNDGAINIDDIQAKLKQIPRKWIIYISVFVIFIILLIIAAVNNESRVATNSSVVQISNYEVLGDLQPPTKTKNSLNSKIDQILSRYFDVSTNPNSVQASIRSDSVENTSVGNGQVSGVSFILDIDKYKQSYNVELGWSDKVELMDDAMVECVSRELSNYPNEPCYDIYNNDTALQSFLPYEGELSSGESFLATYDGKDKYGYEHVTVTIHECDDQEIKEEAINAVKKYLKTGNGLDPEQYIYQRTSDYSNCN